MSEDTSREDMATRAQFLVAELPEILTDRLPTDVTGMDPMSPQVGMYWAVETLKSIVEKRWPSNIISDSSDGGDLRIIRSVGLCLIGCPEAVMEFHVKEADAAMGIFTDLMHMAMADPKIARQEKFVPGRKVFAFRYRRKYVVHDAIEECKCDVCIADESIGEDCPRSKGTRTSNLWILLKEIIPNFAGVQIVLSPDERALKNPHFAFCAFCDTRLPERHKLCPCRAVAYCGQGCQKKHWRVHKIMCSSQNCMETLLKNGVVKQGML